MNAMTTQPRSIGCAALLALVVLASGCVQPTPTQTQPPIPAPPAVDQGVADCNAKSGSAKNNCFWDLAISRNDPSLCDQAGDLKQQCLARFGIPQKPENVTPSPPPTPQTPAPTQGAPERISFSSSPFILERPMAGIGAFTIGDTVYVMTYTDAAGLYRVTSTGLEKVLEGKNFNFIKRGGFNVEVLAGKAYIIGGAPDRTKTGCSAKVSTGAEYDCSTDEVWVFEQNKLSKTASMKKKREVFASGTVGNKIYVLGGWFPNEQNINEPVVEVFNGLNWSEISYTGTYYPVRSAAYATVGKRIYLFGGCLMMSGNNPATFSCNTNLTQIFDTETHTFSQGAPMPLAGRHFSGQHTAVRGKYVYVFGGATSLSKKIFDDVAIYDTETNTWKLLDTRMTRERKSTGATVSGAKLWIFGGLVCNPPGKCPSDGGDKTVTDTIEIGTFYIAR